MVGTHSTNMTFGPVALPSIILFMDISLEKFLKIVLGALQDWWLNMGGFAWVILGVLLVIGFFALFILWRFVWGGGFSNRTLFCLFDHYRIIDDLEHHEHS